MSTTFDPRSGSFQSPMMTNTYLNAGNSHGSFPSTIIDNQKGTITVASTNTASATGSGTAITSTVSSHPSQKSSLWAHGITVLAGGTLALLSSYVAARIQGTVPRQNTWEEEVKACVTYIGAEKQRSFNFFMGGVFISVVIILIRKEAS